MKRTLVGTIGAALATIALAAPAHASPDSDLLQDLRNAGFYNTNPAGNSQLVYDAHRVCTYLDTTNNTGEDIAQQIFVNSQLASITQARQFVMIAVDNLCPQFNHNGESSSQNT